MSKKDIHILYSGGSGGFIAAHTILKSQQHFCLFKSYPKFYPKTDTKSKFLEQFSQIVQQQWDITNPSLWKNNEVWPHNSATQQHTIEGMDRLYLSCGHYVINQTAVNVLLYTDIESQFELSQYKRAYFFQNSNNYQTIENFLYEKMNKAWKIFYNNVKNESWPAVELLDIKSLPGNICQQLLETSPEFENFINCNQDSISECWRKHTLLTQSSDYLPGIGKVDAGIVQVFPLVDYTIKLQDLIQTKGRCLTDCLALPWTEEHAKLIDHWVALHPPELMKKILSR